MPLSDGNDVESVSDDYTEVPVFRNLTVDRQSPNLYLGNPDRNTVYFRYKVSLKEEGGTLRTLYDQDAVVEPGRAFEVDFYHLLDPGTYTLVIDISTFDLETMQRYNGATQEADLTVS